MSAPLPSARRDCGKSVKSHHACAKRVTKASATFEATDELTHLEDSEDDSDCDQPLSHRVGRDGATAAVAERLPTSPAIPIVPFWIAAFPGRAPPAA
jgi:hypothetical protein